MKLYLYLSIIILIVTLMLDTFIILYSRFCVLKKYRKRFRKRLLFEIHYGTLMFTIMFYLLISTLI